VSREKDVDPVGACVGMKGTRVQSIIRELRGEKIDIVEWNDDPVVFVEKALSPAKISRVTILDDEQKIMEVVVEDKQLSLAIGKKGQNVRLAAKLVGWRIDIKSEEEKRQEVEAEMGRMARIVEELRSLEAHGVGEKTAQKLVDAGVAGLAHILEMTDEDLCSIEGIGPKTAEKIREAATVAKADWDRRDAEEVARLEAERAAAEQAAAEEERRLLEAQAAEEALAAAEAQAAEETPAAEDTQPEEPAASPEASESEAVEAGVEAGGEGTSEGGQPDGQR
jgi:N utilization substance protein A